MATSTNNIIAKTKQIVSKTIICCCCSQNTRMNSTGSSVLRVWLFRHYKYVLVYVYRVLLRLLLFCALLYCCCCCCLRLFAIVHLPREVACSSYKQHCSINSNTTYCQPFYYERKYFCAPLGIYIRFCAPSVYLRYTLIATMSMRGATGGRQPAVANPSV